MRILISHTLRWVTTHCRCGQHCGCGNIVFRIIFCARGWVEERTARCSVRFLLSFSLFIPTISLTNWCRPGTPWSLLPCLYSPCLFALCCRLNLRSRLIAVALPVPPIFPRSASYISLSAFSSCSAWCDLLSVCFQAWGNVFWSMLYRSFSEIGLPSGTVTEANPAHWLAFYRFSSQQVRQCSNSSLGAYFNAIMLCRLPKCVNTPYSALTQAKTPFTQHHCVSSLTALQTVCEECFVADCSLVLFVSFTFSHCVSVSVRSSAFLYWHVEASVRESF